VKASAKYAGTAAVVVALVTGSLWPFLDPSARRGVLIAAAISLPIQISAFWLLVYARTRVTAFLAVWVGGTLLRMGVVMLVAFVAVRGGGEGGVAMLLALAGFFFALLLLEPVYFGPRREGTA
jgi:hypothetical protein